MRRTERVALGVCLLALVFTVAGASPAVAGPVVHQAWAATGPAAPANPSADNVYVSTVGGQEQARAFVQVDVAGRSGDALAAASLTFVAADDGVMADQAALAACALSEGVTADGKLDSPPETDCSVRAPLSLGPDGAWSLPLSAFAERWSAGGPTAVAIIPDTDAGPAVFTVSFAASRTSMALSEAPTGDELPVADPAASVVDIPAVDTVFSVDPAPVPVPVVPGPAPTSADQAVRRAVPAAATGTVATAWAADHPSWLILVVPVLVIGALALAMAARRRPGVTLSGGAVAGRRVTTATAWLAAVLVVSTFGEPTIYKLGSVAIVFIAAIGLHLLVNWCGELSLAHAGFIGVPAFVVAQFSAHSGWTPILGLPLAILTGVALGAVVGVAALRARGLQVALVTLAVGIAIGQFFFFRPWVVGPPQGLQIPTPSVFGVRLDSSRALLPVLALALLLAVALARAVMRSTIGRALLQVRDDPDAAAAAGVAVARYRALAYGLAGAFAGLAGWSYVIWVQQVSPKAFPLQLGFTYLVIAALAGPGGLAGVAVAAIVIQGGTLFSILPGRTALYLGPLALIYNVTRYQAGLNGLVAAAVASLRARKGAVMEQGRTESPHAGEAAIRVRPLVVGGVLAILAGAGAILLAWYHMGNTDQVWIQNQELASGGLLGLGLVIVGSALLIRDGIVRAAEIRQREPAPAPAVEAPVNGARRSTRARVKETA